MLGPNNTITPNGIDWQAIDVMYGGTITPGMTYNEATNALGGTRGTQAPEDRRDENCQANDSCTRDVTPGRDAPVIAPTGLAGNALTLCPVIPFFRYRKGSNIPL